MKKKTYMINHILIKQVWLEKNIIFIKDVQKWVDQKLLENPIKRQGSYQDIKGPDFQNWVVQKMKGLKRLN